MHTHQEEQIRERAYTLWQEDGSPEGREQEFWHRAERELAERADIDTSAQAADVRQPTPPAGLPIH
jgi:hypothetical protein